MDENNSIISTKTIKQNEEENIAKPIKNKVKKIIKHNEEEENMKEYNDEHLLPLIKWSGGKGDEIKKFIHHLPKEYKIYIEPFVGGGALYFHLNPKLAVINDIHEELIAFYNEIKNGNGKKIYKYMNKYKNNEEDYYKVRDTQEINNNFDKACRFYYLRKTCFRGMMRYNKNGHFNIPFGKYKTINYEELNNNQYKKLLQRTTIHNNDFEDIFNNYNSDKNFMFLDPPYDSKFTDYGYCQFTKDYHERLAKCFKETKIKCLMVIGKTELISKLYDGYIVEEFDKKYRFKIHSGRVGNEINTTHAIIKNYK